jgi:hypothetical protein
MGAWVTQVGFPVVTVAKSEGGEGLGGVFSGLLVCFRLFGVVFGASFGSLMIYIPPFIENPKNS